MMRLSRQPIVRSAEWADRGQTMTIRLKPLREQVLVVTGATSGNGLATVEAAVARGAAVVAVARNEAALEALRARLSASGARIAICVADVSDKAAVDRVAAV